MSGRIEIDKLSAFDAAPYLDSDEAIAAYLVSLSKREPRKSRAIGALGKSE